MDVEMQAKNAELQKVQEELDRVISINKEWEAAHMDRMKRTKHESPIAARSSQNSVSVEKLEAEKTLNATLNKRIEK